MRHDSAGREVLGPTTCNLEAPKAGDGFAISPKDRRQGSQCPMAAEY